jgi:hypothetical protein
MKLEDIEDRSSKVNTPNKNVTHLFNYTLFMARQTYMGLGLLISSRFHDHTHFRHTTVGRTLMDE